MSTILSRYLICVILLLSFSSLPVAFASSLSGNGTAGIVPSPTDSVVLGEEDTQVVCGCLEKPAAAVRKSYDPHSELLYYMEEEAGRVAMHLDAYYGRSLRLTVFDDSGKKKADFEFSFVDKPLQYVDFSAWDCGTYHIQLNEGEEVRRCYAFLVE